MRVIAVGGGILTLCGVAFLVNIAISHGWFGPAARVACAYALAAVIALCAGRHYLKTRSATGIVATLVVTSSGMSCITTLALATPLGWIPGYGAGVGIAAFNAGYMCLCYWIRSEAAAIILAVISTLCLVHVENHGVSSGETLAMPVLFVPLALYVLANVRQRSSARTASAAIAMGAIYIDSTAVLTLMDEHGVSPVLLLLYVVVVLAWMAHAGIEPAREIGRAACCSTSDSTAAADNSGDAGAVLTRLRGSAQSHLLVVVALGIVIAASTPILHSLLIVLPAVIITAYAVYTAHRVRGTGAPHADLRGGWGLVRAHSTASGSALGSSTSGTGSTTRGKSRASECSSVPEGAAEYARAYYTLAQLLLALSTGVAWHFWRLYEDRTLTLALVFFSAITVVLWAAFRVAAVVPMSATARGQLWAGWLLMIQLLMASPTFSVINSNGQGAVWFAQDPLLILVLIALMVLGCFHIPALLRGLSSAIYICGGVLTLSLSLLVIVGFATRTTAALAPAHIDAAFYISHAVASVCWMTAAALILLGKTPITREYEFPVGLLLALAASVKVVFFDLANLNAVARTITFLGCGLALLGVAIIRSRTVTSPRTGTDAQSGPAGQISDPHPRVGSTIASPPLSERAGTTNSGLAGDRTAGTEPTSEPQPPASPADSSEG
ncbi:hypothetical protein [Corynebacterium ciconiae]|uniref:hypothetical protein n=1 Tax=Corynebacterium ciconiae TaxID=227319 RepID=UPI0012EA03F0|nr:hypothetical protein [Corynebacterium ciconiae]